MVLGVAVEHTVPIVFLLWWQWDDGDKIFTVLFFNYNVEKIMIGLPNFTMTLNTWQNCLKTYKEKKTKISTFGNFVFQDY